VGVSCTCAAAAWPAAVSWRGVVAGAVLLLRALLLLLLVEGRGRPPPVVVRSFFALLPLLLVLLAWLLGFTVLLLLLLLLVVVTAGAAVVDVAVAGVAMGAPSISVPEAVAAFIDGSESVLVLLLTAAEEEELGAGLRLTVQSHGSSKASIPECPEGARAPALFVADALVGIGPVLLGKAWLTWLVRAMRIYLGEVHRTWQDTLKRSTALAGFTRNANPKT
jgi:hypothetical protein